MPAAQQQPIFTTEEAQRFAALWAGFEIGNPAEHEATGKGRLLRRMVTGKIFEDGAPVRVIDALELPEIRAALDAQIQPRRMPVADFTALQAENEKLNGELAVALPMVRELAEELADCKELLLRRQNEFDNFRRRTGGKAYTGTPATVPFIGVGVLAFVIVTLGVNLFVGASRNSQSDQAAVKEQIEISQPVQHGDPSLVLHCCRSGRKSVPPAAKRPKRRAVPEDEAINHIKPPDAATLEAFVSPRLSTSATEEQSAPVKKPLVETAAPANPKPERPGWSHMFIGRHLAPEADGLIKP